MTNHQANHQRPQHHEDYKVQKLVDRIEAKLALQAKAKREANKEGAIPRRRNLRVIKWVGTVPACGLHVCDRRIVNLLGHQVIRVLLPSLE